jgi:serine/threonine protein kinase
MGLARFFHDEDDDLSRRHGESPLGTADYMAPEQALDSRAADARSDIYSLGATLYYLLAGHSPFHAATRHEKILWHQTRQPRPIRQVRPEVPAGMAAVLERMLAKEPAQRYQAAAQVAEALAVWAQSGAPPTARLVPLEAAPTLTAGGTEPEPPPPSRPTPAAAPERKRGRWYDGSDGNASRRRTQRSDVDAVATGGLEALLL